MPKLSAFQAELLQDRKARREFAADPAAFLNKHNIPVPAGTKIPESVPLEELEKTVADINNKLKERGVDLARLRTSDPATISKFVHDATQPRVAQESLDRINKVVSEYNARIAGGANPGDAATALAIGAVVVAVVATPVKVYSVDIEVESER
jgi:hypothetical protein